ncbi:MAG: hypothetical protein M1826_005769 [Phylliscum demangeonii]|nr:MAG: hypothetical protein M1826_005769 [Phylliscum demangeonii]
MAVEDGNIVDETASLPDLDAVFESDHADPEPTPSTVQEESRGYATGGGRIDDGAPQEMADHGALYPPETVAEVIDRIRRQQKEKNKENNDEGRAHDKVAEQADDGRHQVLKPQTRPPPVLGSHDEGEDAVRPAEENPAEIQQATARVVGMETPSPPVQNDEEGSEDAFEQDTRQVDEGREEASRHASNDPTRRTLPSAPANDESREAQGGDELDAAFEPDSRQVEEGREEASRQASNHPTRRTSPSAPTNNASRHAQGDDEMETVQRRPGPASTTVSQRRTPAEQGAAQTTSSAGNYEAVNEMARTTAPRTHKPQQRRAWSHDATKRLIALIEDDAYATSWAKIEKLKDPLLDGRGQVALKDKARNIKVEYLKSVPPV